MEIGQTINKYRTNLDGLGYIVARAETVECAMNKADAVLSLVRECIFR